MFRSPESLTHEARHSALLNTRLKAWHVAINQILHAHIRIEVMSVPAHASLGRLLYLTPRNRFVILDAQSRGKLKGLWMAMADSGVGSLARSRLPSWHRNVCSRRKPVNAQGPPATLENRARTATRICSRDSRREPPKQGELEGVWMTCNNVFPGAGTRPSDRDPHPGFQSYAPSACNSIITPQSVNNLPKTARPALD